MSKNMLETEGAHDVTIWRIRVACWIIKATCTNAHAHAHVPGYSHRLVNSTYCFSTATMIRVRPEVLRYTYIVLFISLSCVAIFMQCSCCSAQAGTKWRSCNVFNSRRPNPEVSNFFSEYCRSRNLADGRTDGQYRSYDFIVCSPWKHTKLPTLVP